MIHIGGKTYELVQEHKSGYNFEAFRDRFSEVLERYDYIVGDWGYSQLRLKGFFKESNKNGNKDTCVSGLHDYLNEYCNFGCAYFIVRKVNNGKSPSEPGGQHSPSEAQPGGTPQAAQKQTSPGAAQAHQPRHERQEQQPRPERQPRQERPERANQAQK